MRHDERKKLIVNHLFKKLTSVDDGGLRRYQDFNGLWGLCTPEGKVVVLANYKAIWHFGRSHEDGWKMFDIHGCDFTLDINLIKPIYNFEQNETGQWLQVDCHDIAI